MDGLELLGKVMEVRPNQKVMMMTAYSTLDRVLKSHKLGADQYLMKPFTNLHEVEKRVADLLVD